MTIRSGKGLSFAMSHKTMPLVAAILIAVMALHCSGQDPEFAPAPKAKVQSIDELLLFFPTKFPNGEWNPKDLQFQDVFFSIADFHYPKLSWLVPGDKLNSTSRIVRYRGPLLQSHGNADRTIPFSSGEKLFRSANEPKQFVTIEHADHNNWLTNAYLKQLDGFMTRVSRPQK